MCCLSPSVQVLSRGPAPCLNVALPRPRPMLKCHHPIRLGSTQPKLCPCLSSIPHLNSTPIAKVFFKFSFLCSSFRFGFCFTLLIHCCFFYIFIFPNKSFTFLILFYSLYVLTDLSFWLVLPVPPFPPPLFFFFFLLWFYFSLLQLFQ